VLALCAYACSCFMCPPTPSRVSPLPRRQVTMDAGGQCLSQALRNHAPMRLRVSLCVRSGREGCDLTCRPRDPHPLPDLTPQGRQPHVSPSSLEHRPCLFSHCSDNNWHRHFGAAADVVFLAGCRRLLCPPRTLQPAAPVLAPCSRDTAAAAAAPERQLRICRTAPCSIPSGARARHRGSLRRRRAPRAGDRRVAARRASGAGGDRAF
jgi:hypothetical protein